MKRLLLVCLFFVFCNFIFSQLVNFNDPNFKAAILAYNSQVDVNTDGEIQVSEANAYAGFLNLPQYGITDFTGLEEFVNLDSLFIENNEIVSFNFPTLTSLKYLTLISPHLTSVDISSNILLKRIYLKNDTTVTTTLQSGPGGGIINILPPVNLGVIDFSNNTQLERLDIFNFTLDSIDLSNQVDLIMLRLQYNDLDEVNLDNCTSLLNLTIEKNNLTTINLINNSSLGGVSLNSNNLSFLDFSNNLNLNDLNVGNNPLNVLDVTMLSGLTMLLLGNTNISGIDVSSNAALEILNLYNDPISSLDLDNNSNLTNLTISRTLITDLDLSNNPLLEWLTMDSVNIDTIDLSNQTQLLSFQGSGSGLHTLDMNHIPTLGQVHLMNCPFLQELKIKNGNNLNMNWYSGGHNNPNLHCIEVDNPVWAEQNFFYFTDPWTSFYFDCALAITDPNITGVNMGNNVCANTGNEEKLNGFIVRAMPGNYLAVTDTAGLYQIYTDTGDFVVQPLTQHPLLSPLCPAPFLHQIDYPAYGQDTTGIDFWSDIVDCPLLKAELGILRRRRCFPSNNWVYYQNYGFDPVANVELHLELPEHLHLMGSSHPYSIGSQGEYVFDLGTLNPMDSGKIYFQDSVACEFGITGFAECTKVWMTPSNDCYYQSFPNYASWDQSSVVVRGECDQDSTILFTIKNEGTGDMTASSNYRIFENYALLNTGSFQLNSGDSIIVPVPTTGNTYRIEADQLLNHPAQSFPSATVEACHYDAPQITLGFVEGMPMDDQDYHISISCDEIIDSYDPNDKKVSPTEIPFANYFAGQREVEYRIRFQNTGSDTAFKVVVRDSLPANIHLASLQFGTSSHPYTVDFIPQSTILEFTFNDIDLPQEAVDELGSNGFVMFKAMLNYGLPAGTETDNKVDIFFDYNLPITTNTATVAIVENQFVNTSSKIVEEESRIQVFPNPFKESFRIEFDQISSIHSYSIVNAQGQEVLRNTNVDQFNKTIQFSEKGLFFLKVRYNDGSSEVIKLVSY